MSFHLFTLKNDEDGKRIVELLRKQLKQSKSKYEIRLFGRGHRFGSRHNVNLKKATGMAVYLSTKPEPPKTRHIRVVDLSATMGYRYVEQPTKHHPRYTELMQHE
jgi:hypothetical protein